MRRFEIKAIILIVTALAVISFIKSEFYNGIFLSLSSIILFIIDLLPPQKNYFESEKFIREYKITTGE